MIRACESVCAPVLVPVDKTGDVGHTRGDMGLLSFLAGDANAAYLRSKQVLADRINEREQGLADLPDDEIRKQAAALRERIRASSVDDSLLIEGFALVREAAKRTLGQRHYDVQVLGGIALHEGRITEMKTGEGKTLTSTLAVALNAMGGRGVHVITVNDYLARRDVAWMGQVYTMLGLSVGCVSSQGSFLYDPSFRPDAEERDEKRDETGSFLVAESFLRPVSRREAYLADITYGTNSEFGFDYLRDNMVFENAAKVQRGHAFAIIDEVDSVLIDEARTPLIISAPNEESSSWYRDFARMMPRLQAGEDFEIDEKMRAVTLTESGIENVERILGVRDIYEEKGIKYLHYLEQALRAHSLFQLDRDYVVRDGQIVIIDEFTGRMLPGRRYSGGLHQALEAKEGVRIQPESMTLASISIQNYFRMYEKLAGMTGTAATSAEEFSKVYGLEVTIVPTNRPMVRRDLSDRIYQTEDAKFRAVVEEIRSRYEKRQPVLVGTTSIQKNEELGRLLGSAGIPHRMLNAKNHEQEARIIAQAGAPGAVTVATNMAGRGVDIVLGGNPPDARRAEEAREAGGLHVIGTERHEARRIDDQLRGRSGRQGDPGSTQFFVSLEDDLIRIFGGDRLKGMMARLRLPEDEPIESGMVSRAIESAQAKVEGNNFDARKHLLEYDDVLNRHREAVYRKRQDILDMAEQGTLREFLGGLVRERGEEDGAYEKKEQALGEDAMRQAERVVCLRVIDHLWLEHLENMQALRDSVRLRAYGQQDPLIEYKREGHRLFQQMRSAMDEMMATSIMRVEVSRTGGSVSSSAPRPAPSQEYKNAGRNDPCPCGSGKKFKKCHGK